MPWDSPQVDPNLIVPFGTFALRSAQAAAPIGAAFSRGMELGARRRENSDVEGLQKKLREYQIEKAQLDIADALNQREQQKQVRNAMTETSHLLTESYKNGWWATPDGLNKIGEGLAGIQARIPAVAESDTFKGMWTTLQQRRQQLEITERTADTQEAIRKRALELEEARQKGRKEIEEERTNRSFGKEAMEQDFDREMNQLDNDTRLEIARIRSDLRDGVRKQMAQVDFIAQLAPKIVAASFGRKTMKEAEDEALAIYKRHSPLLEEDAVLGTRVPRTGSSTNAPSVTQPRRYKVIRIDENGNEQRGTVSESSLAEALRQGYRIAE